MEHEKWYSFYTSVPEASEALYSIESRFEQENKKLHQFGAEMQNEKLYQAGAEIPFPSIFAFVPWRHHVEIVTKCHFVDEALFYVKKIAEEAWSRSALKNYIAADLYHNAGSAITNFSERLPATQSKLAQEITKDTYDLGFITLPADYDESALESALEQNITCFLLELGTGFSFVGRQKEIIVSEKARRIDMLFYHIKLRCTS